MRSARIQAHHTRLGNRIRKPYTGGRLHDAAAAKPVSGGHERLDGQRTEAMKEGILKTDSDFLGVMFKGVGPDFDSTFIHQNMIEGSIPKFDDKASHNQILISQLMADKLKLKTGERIFAYFFDDNAVRMRRFTIKGIYQTNLKKYDEVMVYTDLYTAVKLNGWEEDQASGAELTVNDFNKLNETEDYIINKVNRTVDHYGETYSSSTIKDLNPNIFQWLSLMDLNVWIILGLMLIVAGVTMISGLLIIILERTSMIGVMKALGARNKTIRHTFLWFAVFIIGKGMLLGNIIAIGILTLQYFTGIIKLDAQTYYVSTVPVEFNWLAKHLHARSTKLPDFSYPSSQINEI